MTILISYLILLRISLLDLIPLIIGINMTLCKILLLLLFRYSFVSIYIILLINDHTKPCSSVLYLDNTVLLHGKVGYFIALLRQFTP